MDEQSAPAHLERISFSARFFLKLHRYKNLLFTRWWILVLCIALGGGIRFYFLSGAPPVYLSLGRMIVNVKLSVPNASTYMEELQNFFGTQEALMQSSSVANRVVLRLRTEKPKLPAEPVLLQVSISPKTSIFNLKATGTDPDYVQAYLDDTMDEFISLKKVLIQKASDITKSGIQDSIVSVAQELQKGKEDLVAYQSSNSVVFLQDQGNSAGAYLGNLTKQRDDLKSELELLKMLTLDENVERLQSLAHSSFAQSDNTQAGPVKPAQDGAASPTDDTHPPDKSGSNLVGSESDYLKAKQHILLLKAQEQELSQFHRPKHPKMVAIKEEIDRQEKLLDIFRNQTQDQLKNRQHALELQIQNLDKSILEWTAKTLEISKQMAAYQVIKEKNLRLQTMYDNLVTTERTVDVEKQINPESVTILEQATPATVVSPELAKNLGIAGLLGFALGIGVLLLLDRLDDRPTSSSELEDLFDEPILGQIPLSPTNDKQKRVPIIQGDDDRHALVESFRNLRSSLIFMVSPQKPPRTIVLTSAIPSDGKSVIAANLAITLARAGSRVLLVDADLRRGVLHTAFSAPTEPGLAEVLAGKVEWTKAVIQTSVPNLSLLPRGDAPIHPGELFMTPAKDHLLKETAALYDFVLFDTAPVMAADDVSSLAPFVEGVIMVIRAGFTSGRVARAALDLLYMRKVNVLGIAFNAVRLNSSEYYYYKYKNYYATPKATQ